METELKFVNGKKVIEILKKVFQSAINLYQTSDFPEKRCIDPNCIFCLLLEKDEDKWIEKEREIFYSLRWMGNVTEKFKIVYDDDNYKIARFGGHKERKKRG